MLTVHMSLPPWALPWNTSFLLQSPIFWLISFPWLQTSALLPFLPQCPSQCLLPCQKLAQKVFTLGPRKTDRCSPSMCVNAWVSPLSCCLSQSLAEHHVSETFTWSPAWMCSFRIQKSGKVTGSGSLNTHLHCTQPCFLKWGDTEIAGLQGRHN